MIEARRMTLTECKTIATRQDVWDINDVLDAYAEAQAESRAKK